MPDPHAWLQGGACYCMLYVVYMFILVSRNLFYKVVFWISKLSLFSCVFGVAFVCPGTLQYKACLPACTAPSCPNKEFEYDPVQCSGMSEGCACPEGTLLHRPYSALCISPDKCGKFFSPSSINFTLTL